MILKYKSRNCMEGHEDHWHYVDNIESATLGNNVIIAYVKGELEAQTYDNYVEAYLMNDLGKTIERIKPREVSITSCWGQQNDEKAVTTTNALQESLMNMTVNVDEETIGRVIDKRIIKAAK